MRPFSSVQSLSCLWPFVTPWTAAHQASLSIANSWSLLKLMSIESVMPSNHLILCRPLLLLPSIFPSIRVFSNESVLCTRWLKYWSFSISIRPSNEYWGLSPWGRKESGMTEWLRFHFPLGLTGLISLQSKGLWRIFSNTTVKKHQLFGAQLSYDPTLISIHDYWRNYSFVYMDLCQQSNRLWLYSGSDK